MGDIFLAEHVEIGRVFALKLLNERFSEHADAIERFRREAQAASRIEHPNIVSTTDFGRDEQTGAYFLVMERLRGESLDVTLRERGSLPWATVRKIGLQLCDALQAVHDVGIVHRDLKPANVFRTRLGEEEFFIKILDFGIAKLRDDTRSGRGNLTGTGTFLGTLLYAAPEQADDAAHVDHRADIYALGGILYHLLTGQPPLRGQNEMQLLYNLLYREPPTFEEVAPNLVFPSGLEDVIRTALAKDKAKRFPDMRSFADALRAVGDVPEPVGTTAAGGPPPVDIEDLGHQTTIAARPVQGARLLAGVLPPEGMVPTEVVSTPVRLRQSTRRSWRVASLILAGVSAVALGWIIVQLREGEHRPTEELVQVEGTTDQTLSGEAFGEHSSSATEIRQERPVSSNDAATDAGSTGGTTSSDDNNSTTSTLEELPNRKPEREKSKSQKLNPAPPKLPTPVEAKGQTPKEESSAEERALRNRKRAIGMITDVVRRHADRCDAERVKIRVVFAAVTGKPKAINLGSSLESTTFGTLVRRDIAALQLPTYNSEELVIDEQFDIPQTQ